MTSRSTNTNSSGPVNRRLAYPPPPPRTHDNPYDFVVSRPPPPPPPPSRTHDNPYDYVVSRPPPSPPPRPFDYDYFFSMYDDDTDDHWGFENPLSPLSNTFQATQVTRTVASGSRLPFEGAIVVAGPPGFAGSLAPPGSLALLFDNPRTRQILSSQWTAPRQELDSRLTYNEQKRALQNLRKQTYNPLRRISPTVNLYYRGTVTNEKEIANNENGKRCAICLEDFEPKQEAMLPPCNHMFHEECIVPWVKSNGRCPVCRFVMSD